jgi:hypothetical protein
MILTGREIKDLAEYVGFDITPASVEDDVLEQEFSVSPCPETGVRDDDGVVHQYGYVVTCDGCDAGECIPLGDPVAG